MTDTEREQAIAEAREQMMQHALRMELQARLDEMMRAS